MATVKVTITLPDWQVEEIRARVAAGKSETISGFIQHAVQTSLDSAAEFSAIVDEVLSNTGGPLRRKERAWARKMLTPRKPAAKPRKIA